MLATVAPLGQSQLLDVTGESCLDRRRDCHLTFLGALNEFMMPLICLADQRLYPLSPGL